MRYIAMQLRLLLHTKFPDVPEDDILKVVGNLLYYRYMNPAIVAPDAFDIVDVGMEQQLSPDQVCMKKVRGKGGKGGKGGRREMNDWDTVTKVGGRELREDRGRR